MRFLIGEFSHESNQFCAHATGEADFKQWQLNGRGPMKAVIGFLG